MTKIFDAHVHLSDYADDVLRTYAEMNGLKYNLHELLESMEENDVSLGLLLSSPLTTGGAVPNERILDLCRKSRNKLFPILTVEPKKKSVEDTLSLAKTIGDYVKGFKVRLGYIEAYADDKVFDPLYDYAESAGLPVMFHTGDTAVRHGRLKYSHPLTLDDLAVKYNSLKIVACHFGNPWLMDTAELLFKNLNVYADISGLFTGGNKRYSEEYLNSLAEKISEAIYYIGSADKVIFGTDYPIEPHKLAIDFVKRLRVDSSDLDNIFSGNAKKVFSI
jgi:predicted TIM-barrel fold metal-dependent hydrolase